MQLLILSCSSQSSSWVFPDCFELQETRSWSVTASPWFLTKEQSVFVPEDCSFRGPVQVDGEAELLAGTMSGSKCMGVRFWPEHPFPEPGRYDLECVGGQSFDWTVEVTGEPTPDVGLLESIDVLDADPGQRVIRLNGLADDATADGALLRVSAGEGSGFAADPLFVLGQSGSCEGSDVLVVRAEDPDGRDVGTGAVRVPCD